MEEIKYSPTYGELSLKYLESMDDLIKITELWMKHRNLCPKEVQEDFEKLFKELLNK